MGKWTSGFWKGTAARAHVAALWMAPRAYGRRIMMRNALRMQERMLNREADDKDRFGGAGWLVSRLSPDSELESGLEEWRDRAWYLYHNEPLLHGFVEGSVTNIVGRGGKIQSQIRPGSNVSEERAHTLRRQLEAGFAEWGEACDVTRRRSFVEVVSLIVRAWKRDGEVFVVRSAQRSGPIPLAIEVVNCNRVETPPGKEGKAHIRLGIERNKAGGPPVAYYIRTTEPNDMKASSDKYRRVAADRVRHLYVRLEANQSRGVPPCVPVISLLKDLKDYEEAVLLKKRVEACATLFVKTQGDASVAAAAAAYGVNANNQRLQELNPGTVWYGQPGEEPEFFNPSSSGAQSEFSEYIQAQIHRIATALDYPYELLVKDYKGTSFAGGRLSLIDGRQAFGVQQALLSEMILTPIWRWFVEDAVLSGSTDLSAAEYERDRRGFSTSVWTPPGWQWVDPVKDWQADAGSVSDRLNSRTNVVATRGLDDEEVQEQWLRERMRDLDNEKRLQDYRKQLGLPVAGTNDTETDGGAEGDGDTVPQNRIAALVGGNGEGTR